MCHVLLNSSIRGHIDKSQLTFSIDLEDYFFLAPGGHQSARELGAACDLFPVDAVDNIPAPQSRMSRGAVRLNTLDHRAAGSIQFQLASNRRVHRRRSYPELTNSGIIFTLGLGNGSVTRHGPFGQADG